MSTRTIDGNGRQYGWEPIPAPLVDARMTAEIVKLGHGATEEQLHAASPAIAQHWNHSWTLDDVEAWFRK